MRSERSWNSVSAVPMSAPTMSGDVVPSPRSSSGSLLVIEVSTNDGFGQLSVTVTSATMSTSLWFGGHRNVRLSVTAISGGVLSTTSTSTASEPALSQPSLIDTATRMTAGQLVRSETSTEPVTESSVSETCCVTQVGVPTVALLLGLVTTTRTSDGSSRQLSVMVALNGSS